MLTVWRWTVTGLDPVLRRIGGSLDDDIRAQRKKIDRCNILDVSEFVGYSDVDEFMPSSRLLWKRRKRSVRWWARARRKRVGVSRRHCLWILRKSM